MAKKHNKAQMQKSLTSAQLRTMVAELTRRNQSLLRDNEQIVAQNLQMRDTIIRLRRELQMYANNLPPNPYLINR